MTAKIINSALIRKLNLARVFHAIREKPGVSQGTLRGITQVDRATISSIVLQLEADGLIERSKGALSKGAGRPEDALQIKPDSGLLVGISIQPRTVRLIGATIDGVPRSKLQIEIATNIFEATHQIKGGIAQLIREFGLINHDVRGVGIALSATMDRAGGIRAQNLGWRDPRLLDAVGSEFQCGVRVENDVDAAALAEHRFGAAQGLDDFLMIHSQSGIGGSFYLGNRLYHGGRGIAGEIGHVKVEAKGRSCSCGARGCLAAYVSEAALLDRFAEFGCNVATLQEAATAARSGEPLVRTVLFEAGSYLGIVIANVVNALGLRDFILSGDLALLAPHMMQAIMQAVQSDALDPLGFPVRITPSTLDHDAVTMGGVALAMETFLPLSHEIA